MRNSFLLALFTLTLGACAVVKDIRCFAGQSIVVDDPNRSLVAFQEACIALGKWPVLRMHKGAMREVCIGKKGIEGIYSDSNN